MSELQEIGIPVVEHCNINCKGCLHFCHRKQLPYFADINKLEKDLNRLHSFFDNIKTIRLYGGEPLLHKELYKFIICCKKIYVDSEIEILTNGLLLMDISSKLIETLKEYSVKIYWSVYPVINEEKYNQILKFIEINSLNCVINKVTEFYTCFDFTGNIDAYKAFERCSGKHCHILREGKISCCPAPLVGHLINKFGAGIDFSDGIYDIYSEDATSKEILNFLNRPHNACKYCSSPRFFKWEMQGNIITLNDWKSRLV